VFIQEQLENTNQIYVKEQNQNVKNTTTIFAALKFTCKLHTLSSRKIIAIETRIGGQNVTETIYGRSDRTVGRRWRRKNRCVFVMYLILTFVKRHIVLLLV